MSLEKSRELVKTRAQEAIKDIENIKPYQVNTPVTFEVTFKTTSPAYMCDLFPQVERIGPKTISFSGEDYITAYRQLWGLLILGRASLGGVI